MSQAFATIRKSQAALCTIIQARFILGIGKDNYLFSDSSGLSLTRITEKLECICPSILSDIESWIGIFLRTYHRPIIPVETALTIKNDYPFLYKQLQHFDFLPSTSSPYRCPQILEDHEQVSPYISFGWIGFSFGNNSLLFLFLTAYVLGLRSRSLVLYLLPQELSTFTEFPDIAKKSFTCIEVRSFVEYEFTESDVNDILKAESTDGLLADVMRFFGNVYDFGVPSRYLYSHSHYPLNTDLSTLGYATKLVRRKLKIPDVEYVNASLPNLPIDFFDKPIAVVCNRDPLYAGNGQPWRDSPIQKYLSSIQYLLALGYAVIRFNSIAEPCPVNNDYLLDLAACQTTKPLLQLHLAAFADIVIGPSTGALGFVQQLTSAPTLNIDSAGIYGHAPFGVMINSPKRLRSLQDDTKHFQSMYNLLDAYDGDDLWSYGRLNELGLELVGLTEAEILADTIEFIGCIRNNQWNEMPTLSSIVGVDYGKSDILLSKSAYKYYFDALQS